MINSVANNYIHTISLGKYRIVHNFIWNLNVQLDYVVIWMHCFGGFAGMTTEGSVTGDSCVARGGSTSLLVIISIALLYIWKHTTLPCFSGNFFPLKQDTAWYKIIPSKVIRLTKSLPWKARWQLYDMICSVWITLINMSTFYMRNILITISSVFGKHLINLIS